MSPFPRTTEKLKRSDKLAQAKKRARLQSNASLDCFHRGEQVCQFLLLAPEIVEFDMEPAHIQPVIIWD